MKEVLSRRLPWLLLAALACAVVSARSDYRVREQARTDLDRVVQRLGIEAGTDLRWLRLYPEVRSATVSAPGGQVMGSYQSLSAKTRDKVEYSTAQTHDGVEVRLDAVLPGWTASRTELPLMLLTLLLLALAVPSNRNAAAGKEDGGERQDLAPQVAAPPAGNLVLELDQDLRIQKVSRGVERFGYTGAELVGTPMGDFVERFHPLHHQSVLGVAHASGGRLDSLVSSTPIQNAAGAIEKVVVTLAPTTSSETSELRARYSRLERLCEAICDNARDSVVILDSSAQVIYANASFRGLLHSLGGGEDNLVNRILPSHRLVFTDSLQTAIDGGAAGVLEFGLEGPGEVVLEGAFHALRSQGQAQGAGLAVGIFRDVSEARRLSEELEQARQAAVHSQKIEALGRMAGGVAHDFNNLLATILFNLEAAQASVDGDSEVLPYLEEMALAANKASSVTRQLLTYSRKKPAEPRRVSCHRAVADAERLTSGLRAKVGLESQLEASDDWVFLDEGQLDQVLLNLLVNAKDAVGKAGRVQIRTENRTLLEGEHPPLRAGEYLLLTVKDDGCGIPPEIQSKIFEPYFTTKGVGKGTGLGLSTALAIVEKAGGQMQLSSSPGETVFEVWLPLAGPLEGARPAELPAPLKADEMSTGDHTVLLVEDETAIRTLLERMLEQRGYRVTSAATGSAAAEILSSRHGFDVLVTDLVLPGLSGPELAKVFQRSHPHSPVLFMSGFPGDTLDDTDIGDNSRFLAKPFSHEQLLGSLRQLLGEPSR